MSKPLRYWLLAGILIIATFLRFYHLTTVPPGLYPDEAMNGNNATEVAETGHFQPFYVENNGREGLYIDILALTIKVAPAADATQPWIVRLPAAIAGVLTVWGLYLLIAELFGDGIGLFAAFLLATSFWGIIFSRIGFRAVLAPLCLVWALWLFTKSLRARCGAVAGWAYAAGAGLVFGAGFYTYIAYRITPLLFLLFIPFFRHLPGFWKKTAALILVTFIVAAPIGWYFSTHPGSFFGRTTEIAVTASSNPTGSLAGNLAKEFLMFDWHGDYNWRQNLSGAPELPWPVGGLFLIGIVVAVWSLIQSWRARRRDVAADAAKEAPYDMFPPFPLLLTLSWLIVGILPAALSDEGIPHALRSILANAPALVLAAVGGAWCYRLIASRWHETGRTTAKALMIAFLVIAGVYGYTEYFIEWAGNPNVPGAFAAHYVQIGDAINALPASTPKYVVVNAGGVLARGVPVPAETVMFITHSFTASDAAARNIHYVVPGSATMGMDTIPPGTPREDIFSVN